MLKPPMKYSSNGRHLSEQFEGFAKTAYRKQVGGKLDVWTIAYGHTRGVVEGMTCTQEQADLWLAEDLAWAETEVNRLVNVPFNQGEFDACVDFVYNCGAGNFNHSTLLLRINEGNLSDPKHLALIAAEFEKWSHAGGLVVAGLLRRRLAEFREFKGV